MGEKINPFIIAAILAISNTIGRSRLSGLNSLSSVVTKQNAVIKLAAKLRISIM